MLPVKSGQQCYRWLVQRGTASLCDGEQLLANGTQGRSHEGVIGQQSIDEGSYRVDFICRCPGKERGEKVLFFVLMVLRSGAVEVAKNGSGGLASLLIGSVIWEVRQQTLQCLELGFDAFVTRFKHFKRFVQRGGARQE